jgi:hypothetical protein
VDRKAVADPKAAGLQVAWPELQDRLAVRLVDKLALQDRMAA